jgi:hypothetical protein
MGSECSAESGPSTPAHGSVRDWKAEQLTRLGLSRSLAVSFAETVDWRQVEDLLRRGCPLGVALEIAR